jgi:dTDP-4-amino-4,6-dideoxygalactose transaminase
MAIRLKKYPPVASDLPFREVMAARRSSKTVEECLSEVGSYLDVRHLFPVSSGRAAIYLILKAMLPPGSKVILPGYTCYTLAAAVVRAEMIPILSDSDPADLGYDLNELQKTLNNHPNAKAIVACHLFGIAVDIKAIRTMTGPDVLIIDDAAQGYGIKINGKFLGTGGDVGFYSFGRGKNLSLVGGGLLVSDDDLIADKIEKVIKEEIPTGTKSSDGMMKAALYNFAIRPLCFNIISRLPGITLGRSQYHPGFAISGLPDFKKRLLYQIHRTAEKMNAARMNISQKYLELLGGNDSLSIPRSRMDNQPGSLRFPVLVKNERKRLEILAEGRRRGWGLSGMYPTTLNKIAGLPQLTELKLNGSECIARSIITLPTHRHIQSADKDCGIVNMIAGLFV